MEKVVSVLESPVDAAVDLVDSTVSIAASTTSKTINVVGRSLSFERRTPKKKPVAAMPQDEEAMAPTAALNFKNVAEVFEKMDVDRSGTLSMEELETAIVEQGYSKRVAQLLMEELDTNKDGELSWDEVKEGLANSSFSPAQPPPRPVLQQSMMVFGYFAFGIFVYATLEGWSPLDTCYFLMVTCTTVGYGDMCPSTRYGKLFTVFYALLGMTLVVSALSPVVEALQSGIEYIEKSLTRCLEHHRLIRPAIDTLDMDLSVKEVNATINYPRRYFLALSNPIVIIITGLILAHWVVDTGDWIDELYWCIISMTTIGYGDMAPTTPLTKVLVMLYLPISVAALAQALSDIGAISLRRAIRETDYGESLAGEFLKAECNTNETADESLTEAEFLVAVLIRREIVDSLTIAAVRRQFRELVRDGDPNIPVENRVFDSRSLFNERVKRGQVRQRRSGQEMGAREDLGKTALVDLRALDGGYSEWKIYHWEPLIQAGLPPDAESVSSGNLHVFKQIGGAFPAAFSIMGLFKRRALF